VAVLAELGDQDAGPTPLARQELLDARADLSEGPGAVPTGFGSMSASASRSRDPEIVPIVLEK
jgi:hypothetical protein